MVGTCVIYLFWGPLGVESLSRFAASYGAHPSGLEHRLVLLLKGVEDGLVVGRCRALADELGAELERFLADQNRHGDDPRP